MQSRPKKLVRHYDKRPERGFNQKWERLISIIRNYTMLFSGIKVNPK
jgi:hypothetical protein